MRNIIGAVTIALLFVFYLFLINYFALSSVAKIEIETEISQPGRFQIYYQKGLINSAYSEKHRFNSQTIEQEKKTTLTIHCKNRLLNRFRIDIPATADNVKIFSLKLESFFSSPITYNAKSLVDSFHPNQHLTVSQTEDYILLTPTGPDPFLETKERVHFSHNVLSIALSVFLSLATYICIRCIQLKEIYAFKDVISKQPSGSKNIVALDGLRGFAALLVLADHSGVKYTNGLGAIGVWIFFCLSGYLLAGPFVSDPGRIHSSAYLQQYFFRRIKRILPMYYFILTVTFLFRGHLDNYFRHLFFLQGDGIFWSIPQEMYFYMILPFVMLTGFLLFRDRIERTCLFLVLAVIILNHFFTLDFIWFYGNGKKMHLLLGFFLIGVLISYFHKTAFFSFLRKNYSFLFNGLGLLCFIAILLSSDTVLGTIFNKTCYFTWTYDEIFSYVGSALLLCIIIDERSIISRIMSSYVFRAVGVVGFSFYLIHPNVLSLVNFAAKHYFNVQSLNKLVLFFSSVIVTYFFSVLTYSLIERPFLFKKS